ncbi:hypothetical protein K466DRAFT_604435 [Polyporus arcularius HHB13444]|uniref:Rho-GAP domain-containing protein n=1 Tax=Polyporus arcularius HHB13444 TaxID=1314778 RepID=A0A5C3NXL1_9APHY|nr:hypothetical protein K466DRAFT_604435 [Polyporus arcularius HHB13444]
MPWPVRGRPHPPQPSSSARPARISHRRDESDGYAASSSVQNNGAINPASSSTSHPATDIIPFSPSSYQHPRIAAPERILGCASAPATPRTPRMYLPGPDSSLSPATVSSRPHERLSIPIAYAQAKLDALPVVDMEADRLARACGLSPTSIHWLESSSSLGFGRHNKAASPNAEAGASTPSDPSSSSGLGVRPRARSVRVLQRTSASQGPPPRPRSASQPASIPVFSPASPRPVLRSLREILDEEGVQLDGCLDVQHVVERWRRVASERGLEHEARSQGLGAADSKTFGAPVNVAVKCGSMATVMGGFQHRIPWVVFACVEELNRTGIYQPGLFRAVPHRTRLSLLVQSFDLPLPTSSPSSLSPQEPMCPLVTPTPSVTRSSLRTESMADICALLKSYLTELPEPLLDENLIVALYQHCVHPSIVRERLESESTFPAQEDLVDGEYFTPVGVHAPIPSQHRTHSAPPHSLPAVLLTPSERRAAALSAESSQILIAQHLLRLTPPPLCSLFSYLVGFFTQLPLSPDNGLTLEDVSRMFGRVLSGDSTASRRHSVLMWLLERWARISEGLFDIAMSKDGDEEEAESTPQAPFALFSPPVPAIFTLSTENIVSASALYRPHSVSMSSCRSDGDASVASTSTAESVRTPCTEPTSLFAVAEAEPHWETDEPWSPYRDLVADVRMEELAEQAGAGDARVAGSFFALHDKHGSGGSASSTCEYLRHLRRLCVLAMLMVLLLADEASPPESEYASRACSRSGSVSRDSCDSHHHFRLSHSGTSSRSWPVSPRMKAGSVGTFPPDAFASEPGTGPWGLFCGDSDATPKEHPR